MAITFPTSPRVGDTHTVGSITYTWDGTSWDSSYRRVIVGVVDFPASPSINDTYIKDNIKFTWTGDYWDSNIIDYPAVTGAVFIQTILDPSDDILSQFGVELKMYDHNTLMIASPGNNTGEGVLYFYDIHEQIQVNKIDSPDIANSYYFSKSLAKNNTYTLVAGQNNQKIYVYNNSDFSSAYEIVSPNYETTSFNDDDFGYEQNIAVTENYALVGAPDEEASPTEINSGVAYLFDLSDGSPIRTITNPNPYGTTNEDNFGFKVAIDDSIYAISALNEDGADGFNQGKIYVYDTETGTSLYTIDSPVVVDRTGDTPEQDRLGGSGIIITEDYIIASASQYDYLPYDGAGSGRVYFFDKTDGTLLHTISNPNDYDSIYDDKFGSSMVVYGDTIAVGAIREDTVERLSNGVVYLFRLSTRELLATINNPINTGETAGQDFGRSLEMTDDLLIIGSQDAVHMFGLN